MKPPPIWFSKATLRPFTATLNHLGVDFLEVGGSTFMNIPVDSLSAFEAFFRPSKLSDDDVTVALSLREEREKGRKAFLAHDWRSVSRHAHAIQVEMDKLQTRLGVEAFQDFRSLFSVLP